MAGEWRDMHWGDLVTLEYGRGLRGYEDGKGPYRVYGTNGPIGRHDDCLSHHATVVVGRKGAYRGVHYSAGPCFVIDTAFYLKPRTDFDMRWAYYELLTHDINSMDSGSAIPSTSREAFYRLPVRVPPLDEQRAIARVLGTLDDKIELNRRMNETLEAMARALFKSWFVDFEPVRAKMEGRWRRGESLPGLPSHLYDLFPDRLVESELGEIPEGWEVGAFGHVASVVRDTVNPGETPDVEFQHFSIPAFDEGQRPVREYGTAIKSLKRRVPGDAVLLSKLNPEIERVWLVDVNDETPAICSTEFLVLRPRAPFGRLFIYCFVRSLGFRRELELLVTGTSRSHQRVHAEGVLGLRTILPVSSVVETFEKTLAPLLKQVQVHMRESNGLGALRDALLPRLVSGEIRVRDAETFLHDVEVVHDA